MDTSSMRLTGGRRPEQPQDACRFEKPWDEYGGKHGYSYQLYIDRPNTVQVLSVHTFAKVWQPAPGTHTTGGMITPYYCTLRVSQTSGHHSDLHWKARLLVQDARRNGCNIQPHLPVMREPISGPGMLNPVN